MQKLVFLVDTDNGRVNTGWLCVEYASCRLEEPIMDRAYYPASDLIGRAYVEHLEGLDVASQSHGRYRIESGDFTIRGKYIDLIKAGATLPVKQISEPIPCPKVRRGIRTRYYYGHWQKELKSGWTNIY